MPEKASEHFAAPEVRQNMCIHTQKILDSCINKDCVENLRVYLTTESQSALNTATGAKARCCELLYAYIDVQAIPYNHGHHTVDITFYYNILGDITLASMRPTALNGLAVFTKRVVLCGGNSSAKIFSSNDTASIPDSLLRCNQPIAVVEVIDPMILAAKVLDAPATTFPDPVLPELPSQILDYFGGELVTTGEQKRLYVTIGQFSTVRLERDSQLRIFDCASCIPEKECCDDPGCAEEPCDLFSRIAFPTQAFFPEDCCTK